MKRYGFTLMELMLVVMVIAILVSISIPSYINTTERARAREAISTLESMRAAELAYSSERRQFMDLTSGVPAEWTLVGLEDPNTNTRSSWNYGLVTANAGATFDATATRRAPSPYAGQVIVVDETADWSASNFNP